jgi:hypothetical protein
VTYGFVGLETVSIELDDPFGDDENDFDNLGMALVSNTILYGMSLNPIYYWEVVVAFCLVLTSFSPPIPVISYISL